ncbi:MAG TPA: carboxylesterase/lipase family protein [Desulfomonilia bacterium]
MRSIKVVFLVFFISTLSQVCLFAESLQTGVNPTGAISTEEVQAGQPSTAVTPDPATVATPLGLVRGKISGDVVCWLGIRYAEPPVGALRFKAPVPVKPWDGIYDATKFGFAAPQPPPSSTEFTGKGEKKSEDCLFLNIWAKKGVTNRPVMVWYHGGAYMSGESSLGLYNGERLAKERNVVLVTVNYRLGSLGFLYFSDLARDAGLADDFTDNPGMRDQIEALRWIHDNIASFGGDPGNVTIFGESAGGSTVISLLCAPAAKGLIHRVIAESAAPSCIYGRETGTFYAKKYLEILGLKPEDVGRLKDIQADNLADANRKILDWNAFDRPGSIPFGPTAETVTMPLDPLSAAAAGATACVPLIIGTNHDEATLFRGDIPIVPTTPFLINRMLDNTNPDKKERILRAYPGFPSHDSVIKTATDAFFLQPSIQFAEEYGKHAPVWFYRFDYKPPMTRLLGFNATHGSEIVHVFHTYNTLAGRLITLFACPGDRRNVGNSMQSEWVNFAEYGDPNGPGTNDKVWPAYDTTCRTTRIFGMKKITTIDDPDRERREAWQGVKLYK